MRHADGRRFAALAAMFSVPMMALNVALFVAVGGGDLNLIFDPARTLALPPSRIEMFRLSMLADTFGYYLPLLVIGGYLWRRLREDGGALVDMAALFLVCHVMLGITGTSIQLATLPALAANHAGDAAAMKATEAAWLVVVQSSERGLWTMEGPVFAFWAIATSLAMRAQGMKYARTLTVIGTLYALNFVLTTAGSEFFGEYVEMVVLVLMPVWLILTGIGLWREKTA